MTYIIIGNIIALIASLLMVISGIVKTKKEVLFYQTLEVGTATVAYAFLGALSGVVINAINVLRNYLAYKDKLNIIYKAFLTILSITLVLLFNKEGLVGLLPLIAIIIYLWSLDIKNIIKFKKLIIFLMILWIIYDFIVHNYVAVIFDILTILTNITSIVSIKKIQNRKVK